MRNKKYVVAVLFWLKGILKQKPNSNVSDFFRFL